MLLAQIGIVLALLAMSWVGPQQLLLLSLLALIVAFSSATQDIAIDAYRIEASAAIHQAALSAAYILGYRVALLVSGAGALYAAEYFGWATSYQLMAAFGCVGLLTTLITRAPVAERQDANEPAVSGKQDSLAQRLAALRHSPAELYGRYAPSSAAPDGSAVEPRAKTLPPGARFKRGRPRSAGSTQKAPPPAVRA